MLFGIDLGGTKTEITVLSDNDYAVLFKKRVPTVKNNYAATLTTISALVNEAQKALNVSVDSFGVAIPGTVSAITHTIKNANSYWLNGQDLLHDLEKTTGKKVFLENDANCFALSEAVDGAGKDYKVVWGLILGTGSGTGIIIDRKTIEGRNGLGGEWGHNPLPWMNEYEQEIAKIEQCYCGKRGCIETFVSGTGFEAEYERQSGQRLSGVHIAKLLSSGNKEAAKTFNLYLDRLARSIACFANFIDPDVIVLGGGMSNLDALYQELPHKVKEYIFGKEFVTPIVKAVHGDSSGGRGAAFLCRA